MKYLFCFAVGFFSISILLGQDSISAQDVPKKAPKIVTITGFSYPTFINGETHSDFSIAYPISEKFEAELQGFYDTYILANVTRFALRGKYYATEKLYSFAGMAAELEQNKLSGSTSPPRFIISSGVGYDFTNKVNLELKYESLINKSDLGIYGLPSSFSAHGKYKF